MLFIDKTLHLQANQQHDDLKQHYVDCRMEAYQLKQSLLKHARSNKVIIGTFSIGLLQGVAAGRRNSDSTASSEKEKSARCSMRWGSTLLSSLISHYLL